jgi:hypothetical protein
MTIWHFCTGELITKNTPFYGFLCIQKNNKFLGKQRCSDYKVRYCCAVQKASEWGKWGKWSKCTKSCSGGTRTRKRVCEVKEGEKETCFGNWVDTDDKGKDRFASLKEQTHACNELGCPGTQLTTSSQ